CSGLFLRPERNLRIYFNIFYSLQNISKFSRTLIENKGFINPPYRLYVFLPRFNVNFESFFVLKST
uniref:Uncharacterized protein n=1 Tax=Poecilia reticulata TaxID=8081 RepID=A0A3P9NQ40_POERE